MLRNLADVRVVIFMVLITGLLVVNWNLPEFNWFTFLAACYGGVMVSVMAHNHNHKQMWTNKPMNILQDYWLTVFYGFPVFAWIPTHNKNHHKYNNREGDYTITYRVSERNNLFTLLSYPAVSGYFQQSPIAQYLSTMWKKRKSRFWYSISQYLILAAFIGVALWIDWKKALLYVVIPQQVGLTAVLIFNYVQHVHADEESEWNHSRNFTGKFMNFFLLNNGYHTVHHESPGTHWSDAKKEHEKIKDKIDPRLEEKSFWWMIFRVYILGLFSDKFKTKSMRLERMQQDDGDQEMMPEPAGAE
ncbi:MAG: fatty acid desaturase family protein [Myxococcota bacterium]